MEDTNLLEVQNLSTHFFSREGTLRAVDGVSFEVKRGETLGIAGESGCGKSVTAQSIMRLVPANGDIVGGRIMFDLPNTGPTDLVSMDPEGARMLDIRGRVISMIFQEPMTSFSPVHTIGDQLSEVIVIHQKADKSEARRKAIDFLRRVGMPKPEQIYDSYPFNLSGGMRQRAMIAVALSCHPELLIADEPTTAVDVTIQALVLDLIAQMQRQLNMALIMITHDLAVIAELADKVCIMYLGKDVEYGPVVDLFYHPKHPYTQGLLESIPKFGESATQRLTPIAGSVPGPGEIPTGCKFHPRCAHFMKGVCDKADPPAFDVGDGHRVRCFLYGR